jgi:hypothetical protein
MSYVCNIILAFDAFDASKVVGAVNAGFPEARDGLNLISPEEPGGNKAMECDVAMGAFNYLPVEKYVEYLRGFPWADHRVSWAQVMVCDQHNSGFGVVDLHRSQWSGSVWKP